MQAANDIGRGQAIRLTMPYCDAERGMYTVIYVYRNGWLSVVSRADGRRFDVPVYVCRQVDTPVKNADGKRLTYSDLFA